MMRADHVEEILDALDLPHFNVDRPCLIGEMPPSEVRVILNIDNEFYQVVISPVQPEDDTHISDADNPENETGLATFGDTMS